MAVLMPIDLSSFIASLTPVRQISERLKTPAGDEPEKMYPMDFPSLASPSKVGTESSKIVLMIRTKPKVQLITNTIYKRAGRVGGYFLCPQNYETIPFVT